MDTSSEVPRIFNDDIATLQRTSVAVGSDMFLPFSRLPTEVRLKVWKQCLPPQRYISICISYPKHTHWPKPDLPGAWRDQSAFYATLNHLGNTISGYPYRLLVLPFKQWSRVLLRVSRETYHVFLDFYRLHMPLQPGAFSLLHVCPETDILEVHREVPNNLEVLVAFLHDAVAYDPRGVGIAHLAMGRDLNDVTHLATLEPSKMNPSAAQAIATLLSRSLQTFYSCISPHLEARMMLGILSWPRSPMHLNRSVPIAAQGKQKQAISFTMLESDPRPIETDLSCVAVWADPRLNVLRWHEFMAKFGVPVKTDGVHSIRMQYLQAIWPDPKDSAAQTRDSFIEYLESIDVRWAQWMSDVNQPPWGNRVSEEEYHRLRQELRDVAGLWIWEADTFGDIPEHDPENWGYKMVMDLTRFRPGLMVFDINNDSR